MNRWNNLLACLAIQVHKCVGIFFREIYILLHYVIYMNVYNVCNNGNSTVCIMCTLLSLSCKYMHTISIHTQTYLPLVFKGVWSPAPQPALGGLSCSSEHHSTRGASRTLCPTKWGDCSDALLETLVPAGLWVWQLLASAIALESPARKSHLNRVKAPSDAFHCSGL